MDTVLEDALKDRAYHLGKNLEDLTPGQIAEVEANPTNYLPEGYFSEAPKKAETPEEEVAEAGEVVSEEVAETPEEEIAEAESVIEAAVPEPELKPKPKPRGGRQKASEPEPEPEE